MSHYCFSMAIIPISRNKKKTIEKNRSVAHTFPFHSLAQSQLSAHSVRCNRWMLCNSVAAIMFSVTLALLAYCRTPNRELITANYLCIWFVGRCFAFFFRSENKNKMNSRRCSLSRLVAQFVFAHTYASLCLFVSLRQIKHEAFQLTRSSFAHL